MPGIDRRGLLRAGSAAALAAALPARSLAAAAQAAPLELDASRPGRPLKSGHLRMGTGEGPGGTLGIDNLTLTRDGKPWLPIMGEFHFTRFPAEYWDEELAKMKAAGIGVIASYVIWNHIELEPSRLDWTGTRDLRRFVTLCARHGLLFFLRPGPWCHAEVRFGGIPDWVVSATHPRSNDPAYMAEVSRFWRAMAGQIDGLLWKQGGPVIGMQVENEYNLSGPGQGRAHIAALKGLAREIGIDVPLYTVTGWDRTVYPRGEVVPVHGGYPDEPWSASTDRLPPKENYLFRFDSRVSGDLGAQTRAKGRGDADDDMEDTPFLGAEYGGGVPVMYRRRPLIAPADIAAAVLTQLGSGVNLLGYYMFHGGSNPLAHGRALEETQRSGGYNDVPVIGYDFQAPIGQYGLPGPAHAALRPLHYLIDSHGAALSPMQVHAPAVQPRDKADLATLRWSVRSAGGSGFLFVNNHVRQYPTPGHPGTQFTVRLPGGPVTLPSAPVTIPSGASFAWPIGIDLDGLRLAWATAQPVTRLEDGDGPIHVLAATIADDVELAIDGASLQDGPAGFRRDGAGRWIGQVRAGRERLLRFVTAQGAAVRLLVLDRASAGQTWVGAFGGKRRLILTDADVMFAGGELELRQRGNRDFAFAMIPPEPGMTADAALTRHGGHNGARVSGPLAASVEARQIRPAGEAPAPVIGGPAKTVLQPLPETWKAAATWEFTLSPALLPEGGDAFLEIACKGDILRLHDGMDLLDDTFWDGQLWRIGLKRFAGRLGRPWRLSIMPLRVDAPIYLDDKARAALPAAGQVATLDSLRVVPEHRLRVRPPRP